MTSQTARLAHRQLRTDAAKAIIATGKCPQCDNVLLVRTDSPRGVVWYQCGGYAHWGFRQPGPQSLDACSFQVSYDLD